MVGLGFRGEDDSELSSDDEDQLLYTRSFDEDAAQHGSAYARYKQKMAREFYEDEDDDDLDGSEDEWHDWVMVWVNCIVYNLCVCDK